MKEFGLSIEAAELCFIELEGALKRVLFFCTECAGGRTFFYFSLQRVECVVALEHENGLGDCLGACWINSLSLRGG